MNIICFPFERVIEINAFVFSTEPGMKGTVDVSKLQGALSRIDNAIVYEGLDDIFVIAAKILHLLQFLMPTQMRINAQD